MHQVVTHGWRGTARHTPEIREPLFSVSDGQGGVQGVVVGVAIRQEIVEEDGRALAWVQGQDISVLILHLGEGRLTPEVWVIEVEQKGDIARRPSTFHPPVMVRVVLLIRVIVHHLQQLRISVVVQDLFIDLEHVCSSPEDRIKHG